MNDRTRHEMTLRPLVYRLPGMDTVPIRRDVPYGEHPVHPRVLDVYSPHDARPDSRRPAVLFVIGYPEPDAVAHFGCRFKEMESYVNWAQLVAASGLVGITYTNVEPAADLRTVLDHVRSNAAVLGVDAQRIALWACSGNVPVALSALLADAPVAVASAVFCYGLMLDTPETTVVADAAKTFGFANPCAGTRIDELAPVPLYVARAGRDAFGRLNDTIDAFVAAALARNRPITFVNHATGPHAFDVVDDSDASREVIRQILAFLRFSLHLE